MWRGCREGKPQRNGTGRNVRFSRTLEVLSALIDGQVQQNIVSLQNTTDWRTGDCIRESKERMVSQRKKTGR